MEQPKPKIQTALLLSLGVVAHFFLVAAFLQFGRLNTFVITKVLNIYKGLQYNLSLRRLAYLDTEKSGHHKVGKTRHAV